MVIKLNIQRFADADANLTIKTSIDTKGVDEGIKEIKDKVEKADVDVKPDIDVKDIKDKTELLGKGITKALSKTLGTFGSILGIVAKAIGKTFLIGLGVALGVILLIVGAFKKLLGDNEQLNEQWEQIKGSLSSLFSQIGSALASIFLPLLQSALNFLQKMLQYVGYILKAWFNIDIFAKKTDKSLAKGTKSAKEMNKQLAGFDEMNVLSNNKGTSGGEAIADTGASLLPEIEPPQWLKWIADNGELIKNIILGIGTAIGVVLAIINATNPVAWVMLIIGALGLLVSYWDEIVAFCKKIPKWVYDNVIKPVGDFFTNEWKKFVDALKQLKDWIGTLVVNIANDVKTKVKTIWDGLINGAKSAMEGIKSVFSKVASFFKDTFSKAWNGVKALFSKGGQIFVGIKDGIVDAFKSIVNALITGINKVISTPFNTINKLLNKIHDIDILGVKPFKKLWSIDPLKVPQIPKLAKGGIINLPGKGVMVGGAIGGERSQEGVIPLTDSQQMALLGEAIGKYITINANITNTMNGRVISRELQKINGESDFAFNR